MSIEAYRIQQRVSTGTKGPAMSQMGLLRPPLVPFLASQSRAESGAAASRQGAAGPSRTLLRVEQRLRSSRPLASRDSDRYAARTTQRCEYAARSSRRSLRRPQMIIPSCSVSAAAVQAPLVSFAGLELCKQDFMAAAVAAVGAALVVKAFDVLVTTGMMDRVSPEVYPRQPRQPPVHGDPLPLPAHMNCLPAPQKLTRKGIHILCGPGFVATWVLFSCVPARTEPPIARHATHCVRAAAMLSRAGPLSGRALALLTLRALCRR